MGWEVYGTVDRCLVFLLELLLGPLAEAEGSRPIDKGCNPQETEVETKLIKMQRDRGRAIRIRIRDRGFNLRNKALRVKNVLILIAYSGFSSPFLL